MAGEAPGSKLKTAVVPSDAETGKARGVTIKESVAEYDNLP